MKILSTEVAEVLTIEPQVFADERGFFYESYNQKEFTEKTGLLVDFVQDNHSCSSQNVLRGLHYQIQQPQGKLVRVVAGAIFDVAVDVRRSAPTFGQWISCLLSAENKRQLWIPPDSPTAFSFFQKPQKYYTKLQITTPVNTNAASFGMIRI